MKKSDDQIRQMFDDLLITPAKKHAELIGKGIDHQIAMEMAWGKTETDEVYKLISEITNQPFNQNPLNS